MTNKYIWELQHMKPSGDVLVLVADGDARTSGTITINQLLGLQQEALNTPCQYCGSRGKYDRRGNCGACGAPVDG